MWPENIIFDILRREIEVPKDAEGTLAYLMCRLSDRDRTMIEMRYRTKATYEEIGNEVGITEAGARSLIPKILHKLGEDGGMKMLECGVKSYKLDVPEWPENLVKDIINEEPGELPGDIKGTLSYLMCRLSDNERAVIEMRYRSNMTLELIAKECKVSRECVRRKVNKALMKLEKNEGVRMLKYGIRSCVNTKDQDVVQEIKRLADAVIALSEPKAEPKDECLSEPNKDECHPIEDLCLSTRAYNALWRAGLTSVEDVLRLSVNDLKNIRNLGIKSVTDILNQLAEKGYNMN